MQEIIVKIKWDKPDESHWLNVDNIKTALSAYCKNTTFEVEASRDIRLLSDVPTGNQVETLEERVLKLEKAMTALVSSLEKFNDNQKHDYWRDGW